jgi:general secretion pathway protein G
MNNSPLPTRRGFTLIEMLVVIAIIALLASIMIPAVSKALERTKSINCASNLRQVGIAITGYALDNNSFLPPAGTWGGETVPVWYNTISPYLGEEVDDIRDQNIAAISRGCPSWQGRKDLNERARLTKPGFGMNLHPRAGSRLNPTPNSSGPVLNAFRKIALDELGNSSRTILVGDSTDWHLSLSGGNWVNGTWWTDENVPGGYYSGHPDRHRGSANYLMADMSVTSLKPDLALEHLRNPATATN